MNEQAGMSKGMGGRMYHWFCCVLPTVSLLMWIAALVFVVLSWVSVYSSEGQIWGLGPQWYIWNVVMFGILALFGGSKKIGKHEM